MTDLHSALKTSVVGEHTDGGIHYLKVRLQSGKDSFRDTLHARPNQFSTSGLQATDMLALIGFSRSTCAFHHAECFCREVQPDINLAALAQAIGKAFASVQKADSHLERCGLYIDQPEGWGYFYGKPPKGRQIRPDYNTGNGHVAPKVESMKQAEDEFFRFALTWIEGAGDKGWTTHYRAKHMPLTDEFQSALDFIGGFQWFADCPEYDFDGCWWRFTQFRSRNDGPWDSNAEAAHRAFDAHAANFSTGIRSLLDAHALLKPFGLSFLPQRPSRVRLTTTRPTPTPVARTASIPRSEGDGNSGHLYDVAFSFAGTERALAEEIATLVRNAGFKVFYDNFYPEQLWGKDLVALFDRIYRKDSRYCVMFLSGEYRDRIWTTHERRSATARALQERGNEYILPVKVENVDIDGMAPTVGHVSLTEMSPTQIADLLIKKLAS